MVEALQYAGKPRSKRPMLEIVLQIWWFMPYEQNHFSDIFQTFCPTDVLVSLRWVMLGLIQLWLSILISKAKWDIP